jgi:hypothetical protein
MGIIGQEVLVKIKNVCLEDETRRTSMAVACRVIGVNWRLVQKEFPDQVFELAEELKARGVPVRLHRTAKINTKRLELFEGLIHQGRTWRDASKAAFGFSFTAGVAKQLGLEEDFQRVKSALPHAKRKRERGARLLSLPVTNVFLPELEQEELEVLAMLSLRSQGWQIKTIARLFGTRPDVVGFRMRQSVGRQEEEQEHAEEQEEALEVLE